jgi:hypothetical protein
MGVYNQNDGMSLINHVTLTTDANLTIYVSRPRFVNQRLDDTPIQYVSRWHIDTHTLYASRTLDDRRRLFTSQN